MPESVLWLALRDGLVTIIQPIAVEVGTTTTIKPL
jgi:hypothetical protein